jgi:hypothetical protein
MYRGVCFWLYPKVGKIVSWDHIFQLLEALFPGEGHTSEDRIRQWYKEAPGYPAEIKSLGFPSPEDFIKERCHADPDVAEKVAQIGLWKPQPKDRPIKPCGGDFGGPRPVPAAFPTYYAQPSPCIFIRDPVSEAFTQLFGAMCQLVVLAMAGCIIRECTRPASS